MSNPYLDLLKGSSANVATKPAKVVASNPYLDLLNNSKIMDAPVKKNITPTKSIVQPKGSTQLKLANGNIAFKTPSGTILEELSDGNRVAHLDKQFGGGSYNINTQDTSKVINTGHSTYGGDQSKKGIQRDDIVPVSLGGVNQNSDNIKDTPIDQAKSMDALEKKLAQDYKDGKISLGAARTQILSAKNSNDLPSTKTIDNINNVSSKDILREGAKATAKGLNLVTKGVQNTVNPINNFVDKHVPIVSAIPKAIEQGSLQPLKEGVKQQGQIIDNNAQRLMPQANDTPSQRFQKNLNLVLGFGGGSSPENVGIKPIIGAEEKIGSKIGGAVKNFFGKINDTFDGIFNPANPVDRAFGKDTTAEVIKAIHTPEAERLSFDNQFNEAKKYFDKLSPEEQKNFNLSRGSAESPEGQILQQKAQESLPEHLRDPELQKQIKQASDYVYQYAKDNGIDLKYLEDYFYGSYKNPESQIKNFLDNWQSTDKYIKEKVLPTPADAAAAGLELKNPNPIANIAEEMNAVSQRVGLKHLNDQIQGSEFSVPIDKATPEQQAKWKPINDPVFGGQLFDPKFADLVNSLTSTNKVSQNPILKVMRQTAQTLQQIKFAGSVFHMGNEAKAAISQELGGVFNPKGYINFGKSFKSIDLTDPIYKEYVGLGGGHKYSLESQSQTQLSGWLKKLGTDVLKIPENILEKSKFLPGSPGFTTWMFDEYIPSLKFNAYESQVAGLEKKLGRSLTDAEKIDIIKRNQNFYGEMNERLFGRSGTMTSALRLLFTAPGYGEGNLRTILNAAKGDKKSVGFVINSLITTLTAATVGTRILTGKWSTKPKTITDVRDLFKIATNNKDGNGDQIFYDLMTYDKDYWSIYGNLATGQASKIPGEVGSRITSAVSPETKVLSDLTQLFSGKMLYDYKGTPAYLKTDSLPAKFSKFLKYEESNVAPIVSSTFGQAQQKGESIPRSVGASVIGFKPTTSEEVKRTKSAQQDLFSLQDAKKQKQLELNKLVNENKDEAIRQAKEFNKQQKAQLDRIFKDNPSSVTPSKYFIENLKPSKVKQGTTFQGLSK